MLLQYSVLKVLHLQLAAPPIAEPYVGLLQLPGPPFDLDDCGIFRLLKCRLTMDNLIHKQIHIIDIMPLLRKVTTVWMFLVFLVPVRFQMFVTVGPPRTIRKWTIYGMG
jgi:hypothetical protein